MTQNQAALILSGIPESRRASLAFDLRRSLVQVGIPAEPIEQVSESGARGDITLLGQLALSLVSSGSVVALLACLKAYIARERKLLVELHRPDGTSVRISAENIDDPTLKSVLGAVNLTGS